MKRIFSRMNKVFNFTFATSYSLIMTINNIISNNLTLVGNIFSSLRSRNYRLYFIGQGISLIGTWMQHIALSWLVYRLTGSVFLLGLVAFTSQIPTFVLSPFTGVLTDQHNRLKIMKLTQFFYMLQALTMALLVLINVVVVWHIIVLSIILGIITAFDAPARQALVIDLIDRPGDLCNAIALNSAIFNGGRLIGPAIAGITIAAVGEGICFLLNGISYVVVIAALVLIKIPKKDAVATKPKFAKSFTEGFQYTFQSLPIRRLIIMLAFMSLFGLPVIVLLPAYAKEILKGGSETLGFLMSALGAGALTGALYMAARKSVIGLGKLIPYNAGIMGIALIAVSFMLKIHFSLILFFFGGISMVLFLSSVNTMLQTLADEDKRGRVMSFYSMALMGTAPIGNLLIGAVASGIGISYTILICGVITLFSGIWFELNHESFRAYVRPIYIDKGILPPLPDEIT